MKRSLTVFLSFLLLAITFSANFGDVVINEIAWMGTDAGATHEWMELYNTTDSDINLNGWTLISADGIPSINLSGTIPANGFYLMERTDDTRVSDISANLIYTGALGDTGEDLVLRDSSNNIIDRVNCSSGWFAGSNVVPKKTMERIDPCGDGSNASNWASNDTITRNGLDANSNPINGTPKSANSVLNSSCESATEYPEISSTTPAKGAEGVGIDEDIIIEFSKVMADTSVLGIWLDPDPGNTGFNWSNETKTLTITHDPFIYDTNYRVNLNSLLVTDTYGNTLAVSPAIDTAGDTYYFSFKTPVYGDGTGTAQLYPKRVLKDHYQTIKVYYTSEMDMAGGRFSVTIPYQFTQPQSTVSTAQGYVSLEGDATISSIVDSGFGWEIIADITTLDTGNSIILIYGDKSGGSPGSKCDTVGEYALVVKSRKTLELTAISESPTVDVYEIKEGFVISAVCVDSTPDYEYIELYNPTNEDIDLTNYWWGYYSGSGTDWSAPYRKRQFNDAGADGTINNLTLPACGYYLIAFKDLTDALDYDAQYYVSTQLGNAAGAVAVFPSDPATYGNSNTAYQNRIDAIGYGTHALYEGTVAPVPAKDSELRRKSDVTGIIAGKGNGYDTDNNLSDLVVVANNIGKNSSSAKECPPWDLYPPTIVSTTPLHNAVQVDTTTNIIIVFSEAMDTASVAMALETDPVFGYSLSWNNETLNIIPDTPLSVDLKYSITINDIAMDVAGNSLDGDGDGYPGGNYTFIFYTIDNTPPAVIDDLIAETYPEIGGVKVKFTAPGDNDMSGYCSSYIIAYSLTDIQNDTDFDNAAKYDTSGITPKEGGTQEEFILTLLPAGTTYYISIKGVDKADNVSPLGNVASCQSGSYGISRSPNVFLATSGSGNISVTFTTGNIIFDGNDSVTFKISDGFTISDTENITIYIDDEINSDFTISNNEITLNNITANDNILLSLSMIDFPILPGNYPIDVYVSINGADAIHLDKVDFTTRNAESMTLDPSEDIHPAPGKTQKIKVYVHGRNETNLYGARVEARMIHSPPGADISPEYDHTDTNSMTEFTAQLSNTAGRHYLEFKSGSMLEYLTLTSYEGEFFSTPYPNPAGSDTESIIFELNIKEASFITLSVLTLDGRKVIDVVSENYNAGYHKIEYDLKDSRGRKIPSGIYFAFLKTDSFTKLVKFSVLR